MHAESLMTRPPQPFFLTLMYFCGPFFFTPAKLPLQLCYGSEYQRAYRHFRSNHSNPINIVVHLVGLLHLLLANFALLACGCALLCLILATWTSHAERPPLCAGTKDKARSTASLLQHPSLQECPLAYCISGNNT